MTTKIEWTHPPGFAGVTWNPVIGCEKVSAGCTRCYAERQAVRNAAMGNADYAKVIEGKRWKGNVLTMPERLEQPLHWKKPRCVFVNSMSDLFHEDIPFEFVAAVFGVMAACPAHRFLILTKRPERALKFFAWVLLDYKGRFIVPAIIHHAACVAGDNDRLFRIANQTAGKRHWPLPNVGLGVSVENQATADERLPLLLRCPAAMRCVSVEPQIESITWLPEHFGVYDGPLGTQALDWLIQGGESGPGARPFDLSWAYNTREYCSEMDVAYFLKQFGAKPVMDGWSKPYGGNDPKGGDWREWPKALRVREFPKKFFAQEETTSARELLQGMEDEAK